MVGTSWIAGHTDPVGAIVTYQFRTENHWVLGPSNADIWYDAVLGFCGQHVLGEPWTPTHLL